MGGASWRGRGAHSRPSLTALLLLLTAARRRCRRQPGGRRAEPVQPALPPVPQEPGDDHAGSCQHGGRGDRGVQVWQARWGVRCAVLCRAVPLLCWGGALVCFFSGTLPWSIPITTPLLLPAADRHHRHRHCADASACRHFSDLFDQALTWEFVSWLKSVSPLPVLLKASGAAADLGGI